MAATAAELKAAYEARLAEEQSIDSSELLENIVKYLRRFLLLTPEQSHILALWAIHTYCWQEADQTPYISVISPEPRCGKSRFIEVMELIVKDPLTASRMTAAVLPRAIQKYHPTLFLDEADVTFANKESSDTIRQVLNSGHRAGNPSMICVPSKKGDWDIQQFDTYCPKFICSIGALPSTVQDRAIIIRVTRKIEEDGIERFYRRDNLENTAELKKKLAAWAKANLKALRKMRPEMLPDLSDRRQEAIEQLLSIADLTGKEWPEMARAAFSVVSNEGYEDPTVTVELLSDIRDIFTDTQKSFISSDELVSRLLRADSGQWADIQLTKKKLSVFLGQHYIRPVLIRNGKPTRGYRAMDFAESWKRFLPYIPYTPPFLPKQPLQTNNHAGQSGVSIPLQSVTRTVTKTFDYSRLKVYSIR